MKKLLKRILLILLAVLIAVQAPFIYRRYKIGKVAEKISEGNLNRTLAGHPQYKEYKGIIHAHTSLGGHSTGGFDELISAANENDLDFVIMTEHYSDAYDTSALTLNGIYGKTLFVPGNEIDTSDGDRFLMIPGSSYAASLRNTSTRKVIEKLQGERRLALITYPEKFHSWNEQFDGDEVFSVHTASKKVNPFTGFFDLIWSYPAYPSLTLMSHFRRPDENLARFDQINATRHITLFAGTDAHSNIGFHLFGDDAGNKLFNIKIDPYTTTFGTVRLHVLLFKGQEFNQENLLRAVQFGQAFVGFDCMGYLIGFVSEATENNNWLQGMGGSVVWRSGLGLRASAPNDARFVIFRNGIKFLEEIGKQISTEAPGIGVYRVEVYLDHLGPPFDQMPWIISNSIYLVNDSFELSER